ncbi:MAG: hypothetical protein COA77_08405 [Thaumarchaeota archaeon]|nr:MAG: hypothetical protein COA77_08405 [Nitrososphaerota archaeon]
MNSLPVIAVIGMLVLVTATIGFGNTLATTPQFNFIAGSDNNAVTAARGNITALVWTEEVGNHGEIEVDLITFTVGNEDNSNAHTFNVCAVIEFNNGTAFFSPPEGDAPACTTTSSIALDAELTAQTIAFVLPVNVTEIIDISFTMEETS